MHELSRTGNRSTVAALAGCMTCLLFSGAALAVTSCFVNMTTTCCSILSTGGPAFRTCSSGVCYDVLISNPLVPSTYEASSPDDPGGWKTLELVSPVDCVWRPYVCNALGNCVATATNDSQACFPSHATGTACNYAEPYGD